MDKSKKYIKMCNCKRIQELWKPQNGDFFCANDSYYNVWVFTDNEYLHNVNERNNIWIPRQDQLQKMLNMPLWSLCFSFDEWLYDIDEDTGCDFHIKHCNLDFKSMEQLWLAYVMKTHNLIWNKNKWIRNV